MLMHAMHAHVIFILTKCMHAGDNDAAQGMHVGPVSCRRYLMVWYPWYDELSQEQNKAAFPDSSWIAR